MPTIRIRLRHLIRAKFFAHPRSIEATVSEARADGRRSRSTVSGVVSEKSVGLLLAMT